MPAALSLSVNKGLVPKRQSLVFLDWIVSTLADIGTATTHFIWRKMRVTKQTGVCIMVTLLLLDICNTRAETAKHTGSLDDTKHRSRRQTGDIVLIGLKAKSALKGTTKPSDFFRRIGKKRSYGASSGSSALNLLRQELQPYEEYTEDLYTV